MVCLNKELTNPDMNLALSYSFLIFLNSCTAKTLLPSMTPITEEALKKEHLSDKKDYCITKLIKQHIVVIIVASRRNSNSRKIIHVWC